LIASIFLIGCHGHARAIYLKEPGMENPSWSINRNVIEVESVNNISSILAEVAEKYDLNKTKENEWRIEKDHEFFAMNLKRKDNGMFAIVLIDWPSFMRSDLSKQIESEIIDQLETIPNK